MNVLVAYASRFGSTRGIAECIAEKLQQQGTPAEAQLVEAAGDLGGYDAFVVGSAVFAGRWMEEATGFVRRNRAVLASRPGRGRVPEHHCVLTGARRAGRALGAMERRVVADRKSVV